MFIFFVKIKVINIKKKNFSNEEGKKLSKKLMLFFLNLLLKKMKVLKFIKILKKGNN